MLETQQKVATTSSRKIEANRRNAQRSTGPKSPEGKANSSRNAITHGIFVNQFLNGAAPETVAETEALAAGMWEQYKPEGVLEEMLVQKIVVEAARYGRILKFEQSVPTGSLPYLLHCLGQIGRYTTSSSRTLFHVIRELERVQAARKVLGNLTASKAANSGPLVTEAKDEQPAPSIASNPFSTNSASEDPENAVAEVDAS